MRYVEVFGGTAAVLAIKARSREEIFNDLNRDLVNFWRQVKFHPNELARSVRFIPWSFSEWQDAVKNRGQLPTEILRAAAFCAASMQSKNGLMSSWSRRKAQAPLIGTFLIGRKIRRMAARLRRVVIEEMPFDKLIPYYDSPDTVFYCDPPYPGHQAYKVGFSEKDLCRLVELCRRVKGKVIISSALQHATYFRGFRVRRIRVDYTIEIGVPRRRFELLAMNWCESLQSAKSADSSSAPNV